MTCLLGYWAISLAAGLCFKESGTDIGHRLPYFVAGNVLGISSTLFILHLYARMNVNLAMLLATGGGYVLFQSACWFLYRTQLTIVQWVGILAVLAGMVLAIKPPTVSPGEAPRRESALETPEEETP